MLLKNEIAFNNTSLVELHVLTLFLIKVIL